MSDDPKHPDRARLEPHLFALRALGYTLLFLMTLVALGPGLERAPAWVKGLVAGLPPELATLGRASGAVVYLGDSVVNVVAPGEDRRTNLAALVAVRCRGDLVRASHLAYGPAEHLAQLRFMRRRGIRPRALVVPVNLRAFGPHWTKRPAWDFTPRRLMLATGLHAPIRLLAAFKHPFGRRTTEEFDAWPVHVAGREIGTMGRLDGDFEQPAESAEQARGRYLVRYAMDIRKEERLEAMGALLAEAAEANVPTIAYLTPLDMDMIGARLSPEEMACVHANLAVLRQLLRRSRPAFIDLSATVPHAGFFHDPDNPNDHMRLESRIAVADAVGAKLAEVAGCP